MVSDKEKRRRSSNSSNRKSKSDVPPSDPRLCSIERGPAGYGFNLHGEKGQHGQFIRAVDQDSPAEHCGLLAGDRVIEVNDVNIERETHSQVVARIKARPSKTVLLVVDKELDAWYKKRGVTVKKDMIPGIPEPETPQQNGKEESPEVNGVSQSSEEIEVPVAAAAAIAITEASERDYQNEEETQEEPAPVEQEDDTPSIESDEVEDFPPPPPPQEPEPEPEPVHEEEVPPPPVEEVELVHEEEDVPSFVATPEPVVVPASKPVEPAKPKNKDGLDLSDMSKARNLAMGQTKKKNAQKNDWKSKNQAFNDL